MRLRISQTGRAIKHALVDRRVTQRELAHFAGMHYMRLHRIITGQVKATAAERGEISRILQMPANVLFPPASEDEARS